MRSYNVKENRISSVISEHINTEILLIYFNYTLTYFIGKLVSQ